MNLFSLQARVKQWVIKCFGTEMLISLVERRERFAEEACELLQASGMPLEQLVQMAEHVYKKPPGDLQQEVAGTTISLAALCEGADLDMHYAVDKELKRIEDSETIEKIRAKNIAKLRSKPLTPEMLAVLMTNRSVFGIDNEEDVRRMLKGTNYEPCDGCGFIKTKCKCQQAA